MSFTTFFRLKVKRKELDKRKKNTEFLVESIVNEECSIVCIKVLKSVTDLVPVMPQGTGSQPLHIMTPTFPRIFTKLHKVLCSIQHHSKGLLRLLMWS